MVSAARQLALCAIASVALLPRVARAESDASKARILFEEGVSLAKDEKWSDALEKFESSRALVERPSTVFNIGTTLMRLQRPKSAIDAFEQFLALSDRPDQTRAAQDLIEQARSSLAMIELTIEPKTARLVVDGEAFPADGPIRRLSLDPGKRTFEVSADGFGPVRETLALDPGARLAHTIALVPVSPPPPVVAIAPPIAPPAPPIAITPSVETQPVEETSIVASPWFWVVAGVVVVGAAVGIGLGVSQRKVGDPTGGNTGEVITHENVSSRTRIGATHDRKSTVRLALLLLLVGCTEPVTQLVVGIDTDYAVPAELARLEVYTLKAVDGDAVESMHKTFELTPERLPLTLGVVPKPGEEGFEVTVIVEGYGKAGDSKPRVVSLAKTGFVEKKTLYLPIFLGQSCDRVECGTGETCSGGSCTDDGRPPNDLESYDPDDIDVPRPPRDGGVDGGVDAGMDDDAGADGGVDAGPPERCPIPIEAPAEIGSVPIDFDPNLEMLAADLDGDGITELVAARSAAGGSPMAIIDFDHCDQPVVTATVAYGELRQGLLFSDRLLAAERRKISQWTYQGPGMIDETESRVASAADLEHLALGGGSDKGFAVADLGSGWRYLAFDPTTGFGQNTAAVERPQGSSAHFANGTYVHGDDLGLRLITPGSPLEDAALAPTVRDPIVFRPEDSTLFAARSNAHEVLIAVWKSGAIVDSLSVDFGGTIVAGPIAATSGENGRIFVLLADGTLTGCQTHEDNGACTLFTRTKQYPLADIDDRRALLTAWVDDDSWPDVVFVSKRGRVYFASGGAVDTDAAPMVDLGKDARDASAIAPDFFSAYGREGTLLVVQHDHAISLVGWRGPAVAPAARLWPQSRRDALRSAQLP